MYKLISEIDRPSDLQQTFETIKEDSTQIDDTDKDDTDKFQIVVSEHKDKHSVSPAARYWFQYIDYIQVAKMFIYDEKTGE